MTSLLDGVKIDMQVSGTIKLDVVIDQATWDALGIADKRRVIQLGAKVME